MKTIFEIRNERNQLERDIERILAEFIHNFQCRNGVMVDSIKVNINDKIDVLIKLEDI